MPHTRFPPGHIFHSFYGFLVKHGMNASFHLDIVNCTLPVNIKTYNNHTVQFLFDCLKRIIHSEFNIAPDSIRSSREFRKLIQSRSAASLIPAAK